MDAEIGIVGGGPAGARAAELLASTGADVIVWDARVPWEKPCGGGLSASTFELVPELRALRDHAQRVTAVRFEAPARNGASGKAPPVGFPVRLRRPMYVVSRKDLSGFQAARAVAAGVRWVEVGIRSVRREEQGWRLADDEGREWNVARLVGADGAASRVRPVASPDFAVELAPTRVAYPEGRSPAPDSLLVRLFDEVDGYFWDFSRCDHRSVGAGVEPGAWNRARLDEEIERYLGGSVGSKPSNRSVPSNRSLPSNRSTPPARSARRERAGAVIGTAAFGHGRFEALGDDSFALLGDAAGLADPATGEGIQNALRSAGFLADAFREETGFGSYPARVRSGMAAELRRSRLLRRILFEAGWGTWLVREGADGGRRRWARAAVSAVMNSVNEHDVGLRGLLRRGVAGLAG